MTLLFTIGVGIIGYSHFNSDKKLTETINEIKSEAKEVYRRADMLISEARQTAGLHGISSVDITSGTASENTIIAYPAISIQNIGSIIIYHANLTFYLRVMPSGGTHTKIISATKKHSGDLIERFARSSGVHDFDFEKRNKEGYPTTVDIPISRAALSYQFSLQAPFSDCVKASQFLEKLASDPPKGKLEISLFFDKIEKPPQPKSFEVEIGRFMSAMSCEELEASRYGRHAGALPTNKLTNAD